MKKTKAPGVGAVTKNMPTIDAEHQKRVNDVFEMLKDRYGFILEQESTSTTSSYHTIKRGKAFIKLRKADHRTPNITDSTQIKERDLSIYDVIGFASGVYFAKFHQSVLKSI